ncbi:MAG: YggS family pyridoxal phosphate-dependent enzyme [Flavobacteriales bacterium]
MISENLREFKASLPAGVTLVAVSKTKPPELIMQAYSAGQRIFGENRVQELLKKQALLPGDIAWHQIGHLQTNKVKQIAPFIDMIQSVDSLHLMKEIEKRAEQCQRKIPCLLQVHIAKEESKSGFSRHDILSIFQSGEAQKMQHITLRGLMGIATLTDDKAQLRQEFSELAALFKKIRNSYVPAFDTLSMGMSGDYKLAIEKGSNMIRIGSAVFGERR